MKVEVIPPLSAFAIKVEVIPPLLENNRNCGHNSNVNDHADIDTEFAGSHASKRWRR